MLSVVTLQSDDLIIKTILELLCAINSSFGSYVGGVRSQVSNIKTPGRRSTFTPSDQCERDTIIIMQPAHFPYFNHCPNKAIKLLESVLPDRQLCVAFSPDRFFFSCRIKRGPPSLWVMGFYGNSFELLLFHLNSRFFELSCY